MALSCGLIGVPGAGKTTIYNAITAAGASSFDGAEMNQAIVNVPDQRIGALVELYNPKKTVPSTLEVVDIPGLKEGSTVNEGRGTKLLGHVKNVDTLLHVVRCFDNSNIPYEYVTVDPTRDVETIDLELIVADVQTVKNKINRIAKRALIGDKDAKREHAFCERVVKGLEEGIPARKQGLGEEELASIRECNLLSVKPILYIANIQDISEIDNDYVKALQKLAAAENAGIIIVCGRDEAEIAQMELKERKEFLAELGLGSSSIERLISAAYKTLGLVNFFTAGEKDVHVWTCRKGDKAPVAAGKIHSDMEKGFIRMEVIKFEDLIELRSEAAVVRAGRQRIEGKTYEVADGDIVVIRFN